MSNTEKPLVTFALFAYNQEQYIHEAVEGAFSQTYEPLEIILSDDCSTDRTFEIMHELVEQYTGPHKITLNKNKYNLGLADHINEVIKVTHGQFVIVGAGDDVSVPSRTEVLVEVFEKHTNTAAVFSAYETIPIGGNDLKYGIANELVTLVEIIMGGGGVQIGATYAYRRECFVWPTGLPSWMISEDRVLPLRAALSGTLRYTNRKLVKYRLATTEFESSAKKARVLSFNHPLHFDFLFEQIDFAKKDRKIGKLTALYLGILLSSTRISIRLQAKQGPIRHIGKLIFIPLRLARKISVRLVSLNLRLRRTS